MTSELKTSLIPRTGARRPTDVPPNVICALERGEPSVNHMEQIAMDAGNLLQFLFPGTQQRSTELRVPRFLDRMRAGAQVVWDLYGEKLFDVASGWRSDTARGWAAFAVPYADRDLAGYLELARRFADDEHFAVREWAWLGVRPVVAANPRGAVEVLSPWVHDRSPHTRRFCSEVTRPRGVWSSHIELFKRQPELCLPLLDPLATSTERYVRDSVGNWLNDAARSRPDWVHAICVGWEDKQGGAVSYVCRRARRSLITN